MSPANPPPLDQRVAMDTPGLSGSAAPADPKSDGTKPAKRIPEIDGLRAVAVLMVIAYHFDLHLRGGFLGVDLFFVISGFVITRNLLGLIQRDTSSGAVLADFYTRRAWRLLPSLIVTVAVTLIAASYFHFDSSAYLTKNAVASLSGVANWWTGNVATKYDTGSLTHTWSLAIEEQFYLVLPVFVVFGRRHARAFAIGLSGLLIAIAILSFGAMHLDFIGLNHTYFSSFARGIPIALGVLFAALSADQAIPTRGLSPIVFAPNMMFAALGASIVPALLFANWDSRWLYRGGFALTGIVFLGMVIATVEFSGTASIFARVLRSTPTQWVADRSYVLYLVHFPIALRFGSYPQTSAVALKLILTLIATELLHRFIEKPLRHRGPQLLHGPIVPFTQLLFAVIGVLYLVH